MKCFTRETHLCSRALCLNSSTTLRKSVTVTSACSSSSNIFFDDRGTIISVRCSYASAHSFSIDLQSLPVTHTRHHTCTHTRSPGHDNKQCSQVLGSEHEMLLLHQLAHIARQQASAKIRFSYKWDTKEHRWATKAETYADFRSRFCRFPLSVL